MGQLKAAAGGVVGLAVPLAPYAVRDGDFLDKHRTLQAMLVSVPGTQNVRVWANALEIGGTPYVFSEALGEWYYDLSPWAEERREVIILAPELHAALLAYL